MTKYTDSKFCNVVKGSKSDPIFTSFQFSIKMQSGNKQDATIQLYMWICVLVILPDFEL